MFVLRQVTNNRKEVLISNHCIGDRYSVVSKATNLLEFKKQLGVTDTHPDQDSIFAIISYSDKDACKSYPLYDNFNYYIMTEGGKTFEKI